MRHGLDDAPETHTFRGRSMQDAVSKLKARLGADAVIVATRRGREPGGGYVEITAIGQPKAAAAPPAEPADPPAMGGARGASAAYARAARAPIATQAAELPPLLAALRGEVPAERPFAERAAWLTRLVEARTAEEAAAQARAARLAHRPPYHSVDDAPAAGEGTDDWAAALAAENARHLADAPDPAWPAPRRLESTAARPPVAPPGAEAPATPRRVESTAPRPSLPPRGAAAPAPAAPPFDDAAIAATLAGLRGELLALAARQAPLLGELAGLRAMVEDSARETQAVRALRARLIDVGISAEHARDLAERALRAEGDTADDGEVLARVGALMADGIRCGGAELGGRRVIAFVGPTGVGKTTTVAKVAAQARLAGKHVALITVDTFRMAAVEQLARYAEVLDAPLRVVARPDALPAALAALAGYDLVLIDTTGRSPRASDQVRALARYFPPGWGGELVLTVAASTRERDLFATIDAFARLGYARLCVTKTDETDAPGVLYSAARRAARPLCWITDGQQVPDDIEAADATVIAARILAAEARPSVALGA
ncbi:MAG: flagellar biosynthesis protein FlhF [bacterium]